MAKKTVRSKKRERKVAHLRVCREHGYTRARLVQKGLHHMKMTPEDVQDALNGSIYG